MQFCRTDKFILSGVIVLKKPKDEEMTFVDYAIAITIIKQIKECFVDQTSKDDLEKPFGRFVSDMFDSALIELITGLKKHGTDYAGTIFEELEGF